VTLLPLEFLSVILLPLLLGAGLLRLLGVGPRTDPLAYAGWAWFQGCLGLGVVLSAWLWLGLPLRAAWIAPVLLALAGIGFVLGRRVPLEKPSVAGPWPRWERLCFAAVLAFLLFVTADRILLASNEGITDADEAHIWAAKAKVMFTTGSFGAEYGELVHALRIVDHADYPPLNSLLQLWVFTHAGEIVHVENRLPIQIYGIAYLLVAASAVRRRARPLVAALFLACLGTIGLLRFSVTTAFSDLMIASGLFVCWDLWQRFEEDGARLWLRLLGLSALQLAWSKNEGGMLLLVFAVALAAAVMSRRARLPERADLARSLLWALPLAASLVYLIWFNRHFDLVNDLIRGGSGARTTAGLLPSIASNASARIWTVVTYFAGRITASNTHYLLLVFFVLVVATPGSAFGRGRMAFTLGLLLALSGYVAAYLGTHWELERHLQSSAHRVIFHLMPSAGLWLLLPVVANLPRVSARAGGTAASLASERGFPFSPVGR